MTRTARAYRRRITASDSGSVCLHEWVGSGTTAAAPLVLLHGFTGCGLGWEGAAALLAEPERIVAPDLPGHGESDAMASASTFDGAAKAVEASLDAAGITRCDLHGYSMGGRFALYFAVTRPARVRRLSIESASAGLATAAEREARMHADEDLARLACNEGIERFVDRWERTPVLSGLRRLSEGERARLRTRRLRNDVHGLAASLRDMGTGAQPYLGRRLGELTMPVLVMTGEEDDKFCGIARDLAGAIRDCRLALIPGAGHTPHLEQPYRWAAALDSFIAETKRGEPCRSIGRP